MENNSFDEILTQFARRETAGYIVWGQKLRYAHNHECEMLNTEIDAMTKFNDALNKRLKVLAAENARLRAALKPVLKCEQLLQNYCQGDFITENNAGNWDSWRIADMVDAVREAKSIFNESEAK